MNMSEIAWFDFDAEKGIVYMQDMQLKVTNPEVLTQDFMEKFWEMRRKYGELLEMIEVE